jgi:hypothetical protein
MQPDGGDGQGDGGAGTDPEPQESLDDLDDPGPALVTESVAMPGRLPIKHPQRRRRR